MWWKLYSPSSFYFLNKNVSITRILSRTFCITKEQPDAMINISASLAAVTSVCITVHMILIWALFLHQTTFFPEISSNFKTKRSDFLKFRNSCLLKWHAYYTGRRPLFTYLIQTYTTFDELALLQSSATGCHYTERICIIIFC
jgi:hypothetical protein